MKPIHVTAEPCEENLDAFSPTVYFPTEADNGAVVEAIQELINGEGLPCWDDHPGFEVRATKLQPFQAYTRWQIDPVL